MTRFIRSRCRKRQRSGHLAVGLHPFRAVTFPRSMPPQRQPPQFEVFSVWEEQRHDAYSWRLWRLRANRRPASMFVTRATCELAATRTEKTSHDPCGGHTMKGYAEFSGYLTKLCFDTETQTFVYRLVASVNQDDDVETPEVPAGVSGIEQGRCQVPHPRIPGSCDSGSSLPRSRKQSAAE